MAPAATAATLRARGQSPAPRSEAKQINGSASSASEESKKEFNVFCRSYLTAFLCGTASDWLKGPYLYRFYEAREFMPEDITLLFVAGYVSSAIFGLLAGLMSDVFGRRRMCLAFCGLYTLHCVLHLSSNFIVLLLARAISGVATALLFSAFEAWMVAEHARRFATCNLAKTFALQTQGNALAAIAAGLVAQGAVLIGGYGAPMAVAVPLLGYSALEVSRWPENVGSKAMNCRDVVSAVFATLDFTVVRVGALQCLFEGSMHVFVFLWSPCLRRQGGEGLPNGLVFALYMVCMMLGGRQAEPCSRWQPSLAVVFSLAAASLFVPSLTESTLWRLAAFCCFEWCVGCYFPQIALLRSEFLHEQTRSATMTLLRVPFNFIVCATLLWGRSMPAEALLRCACVALLAGAAAFCSLPRRQVGSKRATYITSGGAERSKAID